MTQSSEISIREISECCIIDIIKENMVNERSRNEEYINFLVNMSNTELYSRIIA